MEDKKLAILKDLFVDEEHTLDDLKILVEKSKPFIKIENKSGSILITREYSFTIPEKAILYLIGLYFSQEAGLNKDVQVTSRLISEKIETASTTLSGPLGDLVNARIISKDNDSYCIKFYEIEKQIDNIIEKYLVKKEIKAMNYQNNNKPEKPIRKQRVVKKRNKISNDNIEIFKKPEEEIDKELKKFELSSNQLNSVFNISGNNIFLLRGFKGTNFREEHLKSCLLLLTANQIFFSINEMDSSRFRENLVQSGVHLKNLSTTLKNYSTDIIHKRGPIGSTDTSYQLTSLGLQNGISLIKDILNNTSNFNAPFKRRIHLEKAPAIKIESEKLEEHLASFAKENNISLDTLRSSFDFQTDNLRLLVAIKEKKRKSAQIKSLLLLGIILKRIYQIDNFDGKKLLKDSRVTYDRLDLLDSNKHYSKNFSKKPKSAMQLTYSGENQAITMLKDFLETGDCNLQ